MRQSSGSRAVRREAEGMGSVQPQSGPASAIARGASAQRLHAACARVLVALFACGAAANVPAAEPAARPNFVCLMADDQGWGDVGYNGHPVLQTPVLDEMAASGLRFDRFYAAAPVCSPTRGSVLTGRHPNRFGCFSWGHTLREQEVTLAEALRQAGYTTGHFGKWHLGPVRADSPLSPGGRGFDEWFSSPNFYENSPLMSHNGRVVRTEGESSQVTVEPAIRFIRGAVERQQPFLAVIWFGNPHTPHEALPELRALYPDQPPRLRNYYGEITGIDRAVGLVRDELRRLGIAENTLVWYTSDNGAQGPGSTGGLSGRKGSLWEGGIRVPAVIEWPAAIESPRATDVPANTSDVYPTLLELAGAEVAEQPRPLDGVSLVPLISPRSQAGTSRSQAGTSRSQAPAWERGERPQPMGFWVYPERGQPMRSTELLEELAREQAAAAAGAAVEPAAAGSGTEPAEAPAFRQYPADEFPGHAAWIDGDWKLHRIPRDGGFNESLFNLAADPQEQQDVIADEPDRAQRMRAALEAWQRSVVRSLNGGDYKR